jgi:hypothetical protein
MQLFFPRTHDVGVEQLLLAGRQTTPENVRTSNKFKLLLITLVNMSMVT